MSDQLLVNVVSVTLAGGATTTVAHGLKSNGYSIAPTQVICDRASPIQVASITSTTVTFSNLDLLEAQASFRIEHDHTIHAEGAEPLLWQGAATGGGGGGTGLNLYGTWSTSRRLPGRLLSRPSPASSSTCVESATSRDTLLTTFTRSQP